MAREPRAGAVKTRLARDIGAVRATFFHRHCMAALVRRVECPRRWTTLIAVAPDAARNAPLWPDGPTRIGQGHGDLGARMQRIADGLPPGPVVFVGTDIPGIGQGHIADAFRLLGRNGAVFGPAADGGYWLAGLRRSPKAPRAFAGVRWSGPHALEDTLANLAGDRVAFLETLADVDDGVNHRQLGGAAGRVVPPRGGAT